MLHGNKSEGVGRGMNEPRGGGAGEGGLSHAHSLTSGSLCRSDGVGGSTVLGFPALPQIHNRTWQARLDQAGPRPVSCDFTTVNLSDGGPS